MQFSSKIQSFLTLNFVVHSKHSHWRVQCLANILVLWIEVSISVVQQLPSRLDPENKFHRTFTSPESLISFSILPCLHEWRVISSPHRTIRITDDVHRLYHKMSSSSSLYASTSVSVKTLQSNNKEFFRIYFSVSILHSVPIYCFHTGLLKLQYIWNVCTFKFFKYFG
jgi:hypothetical protein